MYVLGVPILGIGIPSGTQNILIRVKDYWNTKAALKAESNNNNNNNNKNNEKIKELLLTHAFS
jgi:hypothetical protein